MNIFAIEKVCKNPDYSDFCYKAVQVECDLIGIIDLNTMDSVNNSDSFCQIISNSMSIGRQSILPDLDVVFINFIIENFSISLKSDISNWRTKYFINKKVAKLVALMLNINTICNTNFCIHKEIRKLSCLHEEMIKGVIRPDSKITNYSLFKHKEHWNVKIVSNENTIIMKWHNIKLQLNTLYANWLI